MCTCTCQIEFNSRLHQKLHPHTSYSVHSAQHKNWRLYIDHSKSCSLLHDSITREYPGLVGENIGVSPCEGRTAAFSSSLHFSEAVGQTKAVPHFMKVVPAIFTVGWEDEEGEHLSLVTCRRRPLKCARSR